MLQLSSWTFLGVAESDNLFRVVVRVIFRRENGVSSPEPQLPNAQDDDFDDWERARRYAANNLCNGKGQRLAEIQGSWRFSRFSIGLCLFLKSRDTLRTWCWGGPTGWPCPDCRV
jgi:hypothetical protein